MPRLYIYLVSLSLLLGASPVFAQDDYDFSDSSGDEESQDDGDDFVFDTPDAEDLSGAGSTGSDDTPDFLQGGGEEDSYDRVERKPLTQAEREGAQSGREPEDLGLAAQAFP